MISISLMRRTPPLTVLSLGILVLFTPTVTGASTCTATKARAAGKYAGNQLHCHARAALRGEPVDAICLARAEGRFRLAFAKADGAGGPCPDTADATKLLVDACAALITTDTPGTGHCPATKRIAAGKEVAGKLACYAAGPPVAPSCLERAGTRFFGAVLAAQSCPGLADDLDHDVRIQCVGPIGVSLRVVPTTTTSTSTTTTSSSSTTSTSNTIPPCCGCCAPERIVLTSGLGTIRIGGFLAFTIPPGFTIMIDTGAPDATCRHDVIIPDGGFDPPAYCEGIGYTTQLTTTGCESGGAEGAGVLWDGRSIFNGGVPETNVAKSFDSSDGSCDPGAGLCSNRDLNALGNVDTTFSTAGDPSKLGMRLDIPAHFRLWNDSAGCPGDGVYNPADGDSSLIDVEVMLTLTTGAASGTFADQNGDTCELPAGSGGFGSPSSHCGAGPMGPCAATGSEAAGPCCAAGQTATLVAVGASFGNGIPAFDMGVIASIPMTVQGCGAPTGESCVVTTDPCLQ